VRRVETKHEHSFLEAINRAVSDLKEAERLDPQYAIVRNNLGCVHLLKGELEFAKAYFKKAIEFNPSCKEAFNNLGICHIVEGNDEMARNCFLDANRIDSTYTDPYYNLAQQATRLGKAGEAKCFFKQFLNYDGDSPYSQKVKKYLGHPPAMHHPPFFSETIGGLQPMGLSPYGDQWENIQTQASQISLFHDKENQIGCCYYRNRQTSKTICLVWTDQNYPGQTSKSIAVNDTVASVYCHYPFARNEIHTSLENFVHYPDLNLVFELQCGKVRGWFLYELM
jgi:tetratricopeptide (TPR) repeat protein